MPEKLRQDIAEDLQGVLTPESTRDGVYEGPERLSEAPAEAVYDISRLDRRLNAYSLQVGFDGTGNFNRDFPVYGTLSPNGWDEWDLDPQGQTTTTGTQHLPEFYSVLKGIWPASNLEQDLGFFREWAVRPLAYEVVVENSTGTDGNVSIGLKGSNQKINTRPVFSGTVSAGGRVRNCSPIDRDSAAGGVYLPEWIGGRLRYYLNLDVSGIDSTDPVHLAFIFDLKRWPGPVGS